MECIHILLATATLRGLRAEYIPQPDEEIVQALGQSPRNAADESFIPEDTDTLLERIKILQQAASEPFRNDPIAAGRRIVLPPE
jgi:hypothetical protein